MHPLPGMSRATRTPNDGSYNGEYDWTSSSTALLALYYNMRSLKFLVLVAALRFPLALYHNMRSLKFLAQ